MKVICRGYKNCEFREMCKHSTPHDFLQRQYTFLNCNTTHSCKNKDAPFENCKCNNMSLRRYKLEILNLYEK